MTSTSTKNIEDRLLDISKLEDMNPESIRKLYKMKTMLDYFEAKDKNKKLSQKSICENIGISRSTLYRTRVDLGMNSLNRYDIPVATEAQKEKEKWKRTVYTALKSEIIDETRKKELYSKINTNLNAEVKDEVKQLKPEPKTITKSFSEDSSKNKRGGVTTRPRRPRRPRRLQTLDKEKQLRRQERINEKIKKANNLTSGAAAPMDIDEEVKRLIASPR